MNLRCKLQTGQRNPITSEPHILSKKLINQTDKIFEKQ